MRTIIVSGAVALMLALIGTPLAIWVFGKRGNGHLMAQEGGARAAGRGTPAMGGAVVVVASLVGYVVGHVLTGEPMAASGGLVLGLMAGLGLVGFAGDIIKIRGRKRPGQRSGANLAHGLDGIQTGAAIVALAGYVLIVNSQLRTECTALLTQHCYLIRNPLDLAVAAASVLGACVGFFWWNAQRARIFMGATGTSALGGALTGLAVAGHTQVLLAAGGLFVIITLSVIRRWADR